MTQRDLLFSNALFADSILSSPSSAATTSGTAAALAGLAAQERIVHRLRLIAAKENILREQQNALQLRRMMFLQQQQQLRQCCILGEQEHQTRGNPALIGSEERARPALMLDAITRANQLATATQTTLDRTITPRTPTPITPSSSPLNEASSAVRQVAPAPAATSSTSTGVSSTAAQDGELLNLLLHLHRNGGAAHGSRSSTPGEIDDGHAAPATSCSRPLQSHQDELAGSAMMPPVLSRASSSSLSSSGTSPAATLSSPEGGRKQQKKKRAPSTPPATIVVPHDACLNHDSTRRPSSISLDESSAASSLDCDDFHQGNSMDIDEDKHQTHLWAAPTSKPHRGASDTSARKHNETSSERGSKHSVTFPDKLFQLLEDVERNGQEDIISFLPNGVSFSVHNPSKFIKEIMPKYFKTCRMSSFARQMNIYGFKRIGASKDVSGVCSFYHESFQKGRRELLGNIKRKKQRTPGGDNTDPFEDRMAVMRAMSVVDRNKHLLDGAHPLLAEQQQQQQQQQQSQQGKHRQATLSDTMRQMPLSSLRLPSTLRRNNLQQHMSRQDALLERHNAAATTSHLLAYAQHLLR